MSSNDPYQQLQSWEREMREALQRDLLDEEYTMPESGVKMNKEAVIDYYVDLEAKKRKYRAFHESTAGMDKESEEYKEKLKQIKK